MTYRDCLHSLLDNTFYQDDTKILGLLSHRNWGTVESILVINIVFYLTKSLWSFLRYDLRQIIYFIKLSAQGLVGYEIVICMKEYHCLTN